jgi:photosystem II stability/assembly factor-like uncharacterized protein
VNSVAAVIGRWRLLAKSVASLVLVTGVVGAIAPATSVGATAGSLFPALVTRAGTSDVLYVLWESPTCNLRRCLRLERSNNGGQTFSAVSAPPVSPVEGSSTSPIAQMVFANPADGYALEYGSTGPKWVTTALFVTFNGGKSWRADQFAGHSQILNMASSENYFYATVDQCTSKTDKCSGSTLLRTPVTASRWTHLSVPTTLRKYWLGNVTIAANGPNVWLTVQDQDSKPYSPFLATSSNEGKTFSVRVQPDLSSVNSCSLDAVSPTVLWAQCDQGNMHGDIPYSDNGGATWQENEKGLGDFAFGRFDPISSRVAYFLDGYRPRILLRTQSEFSPAARQGRIPSSDLISLVFSNGRQGVALGQGNSGEVTNHLWSTDDGGVRWKRINL